MRQWRWDAHIFPEDVLSSRLLNPSKKTRRSCLLLHTTINLVRLQDKAFNISFNLKWEWDNLYLPLLNPCVDRNLRLDYKWEVSISIMLESCLFHLLRMLVM